MRKSKLFARGILALMLVFGLVLVGCSDDSNNNSNGNTGNTENSGNSGPGMVNLTNQHNSDTIYWFELKNMSNGTITIGEEVAIKPYFSKQFSAPQGSYLAGVNVGNANDMRQCVVTISGGQTVNLEYNGNLSQK